MDRLLSSLGSFSPLDQEGRSELDTSGGSSPSRSVDTILAVDPAALYPAVSHDQPTAGMQLHQAAGLITRPSSTSITSGTRAYNTSTARAGAEYMAISQSVGTVGAQAGISLFNLDTPTSFELQETSQYHSSPRLQDEWSEQLLSPDQRSSGSLTPVIASQAGEAGNVGRTGMVEEFSNPAFIGPSTTAASGSRSTDQLELPSTSGHWAPNLLLECARAVAVNDTLRAQNLMSGLNELASPYGDCDQRLASYFLQALFCKITGTGLSCHRILRAAAEKSYSFESLRKMILDFQEASPWTTFGHVACNGALLEAFEGETSIHIVDISSTFCTQWPTLLEALATRAEGAPNVRLSAIVVSKEESAMQIMHQIMIRLDRFARLMGVPFEYSVTQLLQLERLQFAPGSALELRQDEALAINCIHTLHQVPVEELTTITGQAAGGRNNITDIQYSSPRDQILYTFRDANPKVVMIVEDEVDLVSPDFMSCFCEALRFYWLLFDSLDESFPRASKERLMLERAHARNMVNLLACDEATERSQRQQKGVDWARRLSHIGLSHSAFSEDVVGDVRALLRRYKEGWGFTTDENGLYLTWKDQPVICASAWKSDSETSFS